MCKIKTIAYLLPRITLVVISACPLIQAPYALAGEPIKSSEHRMLPFIMASDFELLDLVAWRVEQGNEDPSNPLLEP